MTGRLAPYVGAVTFAIGVLFTSRSAEAKWPPGI